VGISAFSIIAAGYFSCQQPLEVEIRQGQDLRVTVTALNFSRTIAYAEAKFTFADSGKLVAQVTLAFVF